MSRHNGTLSDRRLLEAIRDGWTQNGYGPTLREIATMVGVAFSSVKGRVDTLARRGLVAGEPFVPRSLRLTPEGIVELEGSFPLIPVRVDAEAGVIRIVRGDES